MQKNRLDSASNVIAAVFTVNTIAARCYLEVGDSNAAIHGLKTNVTQLRPSVARLVKKLVGKQTALYFHKSVSEDYLDRYIQIRAWLDGDKDVWETAAKEARKDFWNKKAIKRIFRKRRKFLHVWHELREDPFYIEAVPLAEQLIESFQRFESYALDLESSG